MKKITLDDGSGITCTAIEGKDVTGLDDFLLSFSLDENTKTVVFGTTNDLTFCRGKAYDYLKNSIWNCGDGNRGCEQRIDVIVELPFCGGQELKLYIDPIDSSFCCDSITVGLTLSDTNTDAFECLSEGRYIDVLYQSTRTRGEETTKTFTKVEPLKFKENPFNFSVVVAEALLQNAKKCGLDFCSSILEKEQYNNLAILHTEVYSRSIRGNDRKQAPAQTTVDILESLKSVFKAEFKIMAGKLFFEPTEFFDSVAHVFQLDEFDYDTEPCYQYVKPEKNENCANGLFQYAITGKENEATSEQYQQFYKEYYEYNDPVVPGRKNTCQTTFNFHAPEINEAGIIKNESITEFPTLLIWDGVSRENAEVVYNADCGYNYPLHLTENSSCENLHSCFLYKCNPSNQNLCKIELTENLTLFPKNFCDVLEIVMKEKTNIAIQSKFCGQFQPKKIEINFSEKSITFSELTGI